VSHLFDKTLTEYNNNSYINMLMYYYYCINFSFVKQLCHLAQYSFLLSEFTVSACNRKLYLMRACWGSNCSQCFPW